VATPWWQEVLVLLKFSLQPVCGLSLTPFRYVPLFLSDSRTEQELVMRFQFKIQHIMYLSFWTAIVLASRNYLVASLPRITEFVLWSSGLAGLAMFAGLYGVALLAEEGTEKVRTFTKIVNLLIADLILFILLILASEKAS
jgi:hypothetical protein